MHRFSRIATALLTVAALTACGSSDGDGLSPDFTIAADTAAPTTLGTTTNIDVTLHSNGFAGPVTLAVLGTPASWTASIPASPVTLTADDSVTVTMTVVIPSTGTFATSGQSLTIDATAGDLHHTAATPLTVANEYVIHLPIGSSTGAHWGALQATGLHLNNGCTLKIQNDDTVGHIIHTAGEMGLPHGEVGGVGTPPGGSYSGVINGDPGDATLIACHSHNHADTLRITTP